MHMFAHRTHSLGGQAAKDFRRRTHEPRAEAQAFTGFFPIDTWKHLLALELQVVGASMVWSQAKDYDEFGGNQCEVPQLCTA